MKNLLNLLWRDRGPFFKTFVTSELISVIAGLLWTEFDNTIDQMGMPEKYQYPLCDFDSHMGQHLAILIAVRWLIVSIFLSTITSRYFSSASDNSLGLQRSSMRCGNAFILGLSAVLTLAGMFVEYAIFHKIMGTAFNPDPTQYPDGIIDCSKSLSFRFASDAFINASAPAVYLTGITFFSCLKHRSEERQQLVHANFALTAPEHNSAL